MATGMGMMTRVDFSTPIKEPNYVGEKFAWGFDVEKGDITSILFWAEHCYDRGLGVLATERVMVARLLMTKQVFERDANRACQCVPINEREFIRFPGVVS